MPSFIDGRHQVSGYHLQVRLSCCFLFFSAFESWVIEWTKIRAPTGEELQWQH